jgi:ubiquinol-cytochrome c reductase iron-sulfur subunit
MSELQAHAPGTDVAAGDHLPERFANPGLPPHRPRLTDVDPAAARRAERVVATCFGLSAVGTVVAIVGYFAVQLNTSKSFDENLLALQRSNLVLGLGTFLALFGIGIGAVHWAKTLMSDVELSEERHLQRGSAADRDAAVEILKTGAAESAIGRRPLIRNTLIGAMALLPLPAVVMFRDLGPLPQQALEETLWKAGTPLVTDPDGHRIKASSLVQGSVVHVIPEPLSPAARPAAEHPLEAKAGSYDGIVAYSKVCTHMGCPVALYEQQTHHLLCPCHQSTFDLTQNCAVIFGPAKRALPQLPIEVDAEGYLVAKTGFSVPVGPSYWERS